MENKRNRNINIGKIDTIFLEVTELPNEKREEKPTYDNPSSEWMRFFYDCFLVESQRAEMQYYCKSLLVMLIEVTLFMAYVALMVCSWMMSKETCDFLFFLILIIIVLALGGLGLCFLYKLNHKITVYRKNENQENYFQRCKNQAYEVKTEASEFEIPKCELCEISHKWLWVIWAILGVIAMAVFGYKIFTH